MSFYQELPYNIEVLEPEAIASQQQEQAVKRTTGKGKVYIPFCSFKSEEDAVEIFKKNFLSQSWCRKKLTDNLFLRFKLTNCLKKKKKKMV